MKKLIFFMMGLLPAMVTWADVEINETNFPDVTFRNWVLSQEYGSDGMLTDGEIAGITIINVSGRKIQSLKGIEFFTALVELWANNNQLTTLDVSQNTALQTLVGYKNQLTTLDLSQNTALTGLDIFSNQLMSLDLSNNTALTQLYCDVNQLTTLDV